MTKPMYCPMSFNNSDDRGAWQVCTPNCAWAIEAKGKYACALPLYSAAAARLEKATINSRPLKDDSE